MRKGTRKIAGGSSTWNYRVMRQRTAGGMLYSIREVYYDKEGTVTGFTDPSAVCSGTKRGMAWVLDTMQRALKNPALDYEKITGLPRKAR